MKKYIYPLLGFILAFAIGSGIIWASEAPNGGVEVNEESEMDFPADDDNEEPFIMETNKVNLKEKTFSSFNIEAPKEIENCTN